MNEKAPGWRPAASSVVLLLCEVLHGASDEWLGLKSLDKIDW